MIFGDPSDFAIEAMTESYLLPPSPVWGRTCVRIGGVTLGDYNDPCCGMAGAYSRFSRVKERISCLWDPSFDSLDDNQIFDLLDQKLYGDDDRSTAEILRDSDRFHRFVFLTNWDEQFDGYKCFVMDRGPQEVLILYQLPDDTRGSASVTADGFVKAIEGFLAWYDCEEERLEAKQAAKQSEIPEDNVDQVAILKKYSAIPSTSFTFLSTANDDDLRKLGTGIIFVIAFRNRASFSSFRVLTQALATLESVPPLLVVDIEGLDSQMIKSVLGDFDGEWGETFWLSEGQITQHLLDHISIDATDRIRELSKSIREN